MYHVNTQQNCFTSLHFGCVHAQLLQSCPTLCNPMDCSLPGPSVHGILQARILEWVAMPSSRGSSQPKDEPTSPASPALAGRFFTAEPPGKPKCTLSPNIIWHIKFSVHKNLHLIYYFTQPKFCFRHSRIGRS